MKMQVKKLHPKAIIPTYGTAQSAGADLYVCLEEPVIIAPGETKLLPMGVTVVIPEGHAGLVFARSGLATKSGLAPANKVGVIDADYRGPLMVPLHNHSQEVRTVNHGDRVAQLLIVPVAMPELVEVQDLDETQRGLGGFGSTGV